jgi:hypothetical protein
MAGRWGDWMTGASVSRLGTVYFALWLIVPIVGVPFATLLVDPKRYTPRTVAYIEILWPLFFCLYSLVVQARFPKVLHQALPTTPRLILVSAVSGQASFHALLVISGGMTAPQTILHSALFVLTVGFTALILSKPSFGLMLIYSVSFLALCLWAVTDFSLRVQFDVLSFALEAVADSLVLPALWIVSLAAVLTMMLRKFRCPNPQGPLRYALGLGVILTLIVFGDLYYKIALFTRGDAFEYTKKAVTLQSKRRIAQVFPGLPSKLYDALIEESLSSEIASMTFKDGLSGISLYVPSSREGTIGQFWGTFYELRLKLEGATQYRFVKYDKPTNLKDDDLYELLLYKANQPPSAQQEQEWHSLLGVRPYDEHTAPFAKYIVEFPKSMGYHSGPATNGPSESSQYTLAQPHGEEPDVIVHTSGKNVIPDIYSNYLFDVGSLSLYLDHAHSYLDDSETKLEQITRTDYLDSFLDYLYFSVITMSTTGYGDIVAIHPIARSLTIAEIAIGWFLLLWFGSLIIAGINKKRAE